jgi:crotonobetaine/carnitine-CoA ligase
MTGVGDETIRATMDRRARETPGDVFLVFEDRPLTFAALDMSVNRVANGLLAAGLRKGDRVALMLPSHPDHVVAILALAKIGLVRIPVNVHLKGAALEYALAEYEPAALIAEHAYADALAGHAIPCVFWRNGGAPGFESLAAFADASPPPVRVDADDIIAITPSSGTTGAPKGVDKSDRTLRAGPIATRILSDRKAGDVLLFWEALHHGAGVAVVIGAILERITLAMVPRFSASRFWDDARRYEVTHIHYLGTVLQMLLKQPPGPQDRAHGVRIAWGGGCPLEIWRAFEARFGVEVREGYGLSELITFVTVNRDGPEGSIGKPLPWYEVRVADESGDEVPVGDAGEICVASADPRIGFLGYCDQPQASAGIVRERDGRRWVRTGDLARRDADGSLYFAGRTRDSVRRRGINISAWEVERVVNDHPDIEESALVGVPSDLGEDELMIYLRPVDGRGVDPAAFIAWCEPRLPYFQVPRYVAVVADFPRTPTQRIRKGELARDPRSAWDRESVH